MGKNNFQQERRNEGAVLGPVFRRPIIANLRFNFNPGFFFYYVLSESIFSGNFLTSLKTIQSL